MALGIYESADSSTLFSQGTFTNPASFTFDGVAGGYTVRRYYVRNNNLNYWYSSIQLQPVSIGSAIIDGSNGYSWKLIAGDSEPLAEQWSLVTAASAISLSNIGSAAGGDISTYLPFWIKIEIPAAAPVASYRGAIIRISATETAV